MLLSRANFLSACAVFAEGIAINEAQTERSPTKAGETGLLSGFLRGPWTNEQVREEWTPEGIHTIALAPPVWEAGRNTHLIIYATPNGSTAEQTLGSKLEGGTDWHFDIQHIAAQTRWLRQRSPTENILLVCVQADGLSWPAWRQKHGEKSGALIRALVADWTSRAKMGDASAPVQVALTGHSGGGSFLLGFLNGGATLPDTIERIAFLDANYSYSDTERHGDKLLAWLGGDTKRRLVVVAYDDRDITINGKKVVGPTGGTYRATERMRVRWEKAGPLHTETVGEFHITADARKQTFFAVHPNPDTKILHTALVGEMNGFLYAMGAPKQKMGSPRAYTAFVQPAAQLPLRTARTSGEGGSALLTRIASLPLADRENAIVRALETGNVPDFLRIWKPVTVSWQAAEKTYTATFEVLPDYLCVGTNADWVRVPLTPMSAQRLAWAFGAGLPTRKMVDAIYKAAEEKSAPIPMTEAREAIPTFLQHNALIEAQRQKDSLGKLIAGIKKDVVVTNRLAEKPNRVAIYGWHTLDGLPIQPLTIVHRDTYVDYSHGVRLVKREMTVDGKKRDIFDILRDPILSGLLSDEGAILRPLYPGL